MKEKVIFFDFDNTLVDSLDYWKKTIEKSSLSHYGKKVDNSLKGLLNGGNNIEKANKAIKLAGIDASTQEVLDFWSEEMQYFYTHKIKMIKGAKEFLINLKKQGKKLILASATDEKTLKIALKHFDINFFDEIFTEPEFGIPKNNPKFFDICCQNLEIGLDEILYFEDSFSAIETASQLGIKTIGLIHKYNKKHKKRLNEICHLVIKDYKGLNKSVRNFL